MWPFRKREDWRNTQEEGWRTFGGAGEYSYQINCVKQVRFPDGVTRWKPRVYEFGYLDRLVRDGELGQ